MMKVGLALGGGGARGMAHVLVLEALDDLGITPAAIAGTSMGAIVGALYASGMSGKQIRKIVGSHFILKGDRLGDVYRKKGNLVKWLSGFRLTGKKTGLLQADGLMHHLLTALQADTFEQLKIPFQAVTTDFYQGRPLVLRTGELLPAIRASMSVPGVFVPVEHEGRVLVDGGLTNQLPYDLLPDDCDVTIAIDVGPTLDAGTGQPPSASKALLGMFDIMVDQAIATKLEAHPPTIYIRPKLTGIQILDFDKVTEVFEQAQPAIDELKARLAEL